MKLPVLFKNDTISKSDDKEAPKAVRLKTIEDYVDRSSELKSNA